MKNLKIFLQKNHRVIEFSSNKYFINNDLLSGEIFLSIFRANNLKDDKFICLSRQHFLRAIKNGSSSAL